MTEKTLVLIKPPHSQDVSSIADIIGRYTQSGLKVAGFKEIRMTGQLLEQLYLEHREKSFFPVFVRAYLCQRFIALCLEGNGAIRKVRELNGHSNPRKAAQGTIRHGHGDFELTPEGFYSPHNAVHGADSPGSAIREINIFFSEEELQQH